MDDPDVTRITNSRACCEVLPGLFLGSWEAEMQAGLLQAHGITHILQAAHEVKPSHPDRFTYLHLPAEDTSYQDLVLLLPEACGFIQGALEQGQRVLVHCVMGVSRSAAVVCAYIMCQRRASFLDTLAAVRALRPIVNPNPGFRLQLRLLEEAGWNLQPWAGWGKDRFQAERARRAGEPDGALVRAGAVRGACEVAAPLLPDSAPGSPAAGSYAGGGGAGSIIGGGGSDGADTIGPCWWPRAHLFTGAVAEDATTARPASGVFSPPAASRPAASPPTAGVFAAATAAASRLAASRPPAGWPASDMTPDEAAADVWRIVSGHCGLVSGQCGIVSGQCGLQPPRRLSLAGQEPPCTPLPDAPGQVPSRPAGSFNGVLGQPATRPQLPAGHAPQLLLRSKGGSRSSGGQAPQPALLSPPQLSGSPQPPLLPSPQLAGDPELLQALQPPHPPGGHRGQGFKNTFTSFQERSPPPALDTLDTLDPPWMTGNRGLSTSFTSPGSITGRCRPCHHPLGR